MNGPRRDPALVNPYAPGAGTKPPVMVGRETQLSVVDGAARQVEAGRRPPHLVLTGLRGVGKTVLIREALAGLRERGWLCGYCEVRRDVEVGVALGTILADGAALLPRRKKLAAAVRHMTATIGSVTFSAAPDGTIGISVAPNREGGAAPDAYRAALRLFRDLGQAARDDGAGVALGLDELQSMRRKDATTLLQALEADEAEDTRILLLGAGLPTTPTELSKSRTYAERFRYEPLDDLTVYEARRAVEEPSKALGVAWEADALERVIGLAHGYPYFLQLYASESWETSAPSAVVTSEDVEQAIPRVKRSLDHGLYGTRWQRASQLERQYLIAMAQLMTKTGAQVARSGDVARTMGRDLSDLSAIRDRLIQKGVIHSPASGRIQFSVPGFGEFVIARSTDETGP